MRFDRHAEQFIELESSLGQSQGIDPQVLAEPGVVRNLRQGTGVVFGLFG